MMFRNSALGVLLWCLPSLGASAQPVAPPAALAAPSPSQEAGSVLFGAWRHEGPGPGSMTTTFTPQAITYRAVDGEGRVQGEDTAKVRYRAGEDNIVIVELIEPDGTAGPSLFVLIKSSDHVLLNVPGAATFKLHREKPQ